MDLAPSDVHLPSKMVQDSDNCTETYEKETLKSTELIKLTNFDEKILIQAESKDFTLHLCKNYKITICKALIPLKLTLFIYYGAGSFMTSFLTVLYKQRGISLSELSTMTVISPLFQFLGTSLSGITADKLGRSKPVLIANLLIYISVLICIVLLSSVSHNKNDNHHINITCHQGFFMVQTDCEYLEKEIEMKSCSSHCLEQFENECAETNSTCKFFYGKDAEKNVTLFIKTSNASVQKTNEFCRYDTWSLTYENITYSKCTEEQKYCLLSCTVKPGLNQLHGALSGLFMAYVVLYVLFQTTYSNCYRCLDITCMFLVKEHDSNFGHERFFAMLGNVLVSPLAGYVADLTTPPDGERNYSAAIYLAIGMNFLLLFILYKLPVKVNTPGKKMWKKSLNLLKNCDAVMFLIVILILGTAWNIGKYFLFWHLEELNASSLLIGLITSVSALYGLPFLLTSQWWVEKVGPTRIFILALLGYSVNSAGYSFLYDPWFSLLLEVTGTISYFLLWVAVVEYSHDLAPAGLRATVIAISGAIHFSIGKVSSGLMGKFLMDHFGGRRTFAFSAIFYVTSAILYAFYVYFKNKCLKLRHEGVPTEEYNEE